MTREISLRPSGNEIAPFTDTTYNAEWAKKSGVSKLTMGVWWHEAVPQDVKFGETLVATLKAIGCNIRANGQEMSTDFLPGMERSLATSGVFAGADIVHIILSSEAANKPGNFHRGLSQLASRSIEYPEGWISTVPIKIDPKATLPRALTAYAAVDVNIQDLAHEGVKLFKSWELAARQRGFDKKK
jgi:hypothetical protein